MSKKAKAFTCPDCGKAFTSEWGMDEHRAFTHGTVRKVFSPSQRRGLPPPLPADRRPTATEIDPTCLECGGEGKLVGGEAIYPHRPDLYAKRFYLCACGAYCGCHPGSIVPLGHPCGPETRKARSAAHAAFDPLWKQDRSMSRASAYKWLADATGIPRERCHIGMMTAEQARQVVEAVEGRMVDRAIDRLVAEGKATRDGDQVTLTPARHRELLAAGGDAEQ